MQLHLAPSEISSGSARAIASQTDPSRANRPDPESFAAVHQSITKQNVNPQAKPDSMSSDDSNEDPDNLASTLATIPFETIVPLRPMEISPELSNEQVASSAMPGGLVSVPLTAKPSTDSKTAARLDSTKAGSTPPSPIDLNAIDSQDSEQGAMEKLHNVEFNVSKKADHDSNAATNDVVEVSSIESAVNAETAGDSTGLAGHISQAKMDGVFDARLATSAMDRFGSTTTTIQSSAVESVSENLVQQMQLVEKGQSSQLTIQLHPAELGQVTLQVDWDQEVLKARIVVNEAATNEMLNQNKQHMVQALADQGLSFDSLDISWQGPDAQPDLEQQGSGGRTFASASHQVDGTPESNVSLGLSKSNVTIDVVA